MATWDDVRRIALALPQTTEASSHGLARIATDELEELIVEAWLARAPKPLAKQYLDKR